MTPTPTVPPGSARHDATVLFADLSGFVDIADRLDAEEVTALINECFSRLDRVVFAHGGTVVQYIGDCLVAVFGLSAAADVPAEHALRAALEIRAAVQQFNRDRLPPHPLDIHIGIDTGPVLAAVIGGTAKRSITLAGTTVQRATALENASAAGQIFVGPGAHATTRDAFEYRALEPFAVEGGRERLAVYELLGPRPLRRATRASERRRATVLFAEVLGLHTLPDDTGGDAFLSCLDECCTAVGDIVVANGGSIDKYVGESIMALFGVPNAIEQAPQRAINAALEIRHAVADIAARRGGHPPLQVRIGINTGLVVAGEVGGATRREFTVMGDAVNLAARLRERAAAGTILIGSDTYRDVAADFECGAVEPLQIKGKAQPVAAMEVVSLAGPRHALRDDRPAGLVHAELVGRDAELLQLLTEVEAAADGQGGVVAVVGEAGIGKSRLVAEATARTTHLPLRWLLGRSVATGQRRSFHPFVGLLRHWAGIAEDDPDDRASARLAQAIAAVVPANEVAEVFPFVATLMGLRVEAPDADRLAGIEGESLEKLIVRSMRVLLQAIAAQRPLALTFEDLHWTDSSSLMLLEALLPLATEAPVSFVITARPEGSDACARLLARCRDGHGGRHTEIALTPLDDVQCGTLVDRLLRTDDLPQSVRALITRKAEGNPFFVEEVVRSLIDEGAVVAAQGRMLPTEKLDSVQIPGTVQEVIMARVDRLDEALRHLLQVGAVIGRSFPHRLIAAIVGDELAPGTSLDDQLGDLTRRQLLGLRRTRRTGAVRRAALRDEVEYVFQHALVQETVYGSILQRTRKELHLQVAQTIERVFFHRLADFYGMLAYHYSRGDELEKAEEYLFKAGDEAARVAASSEALEFFREASRIYLLLHGTGGDPKKKSILEKNIALALLNHGELSESIEHFDRAATHLGQRIAGTPTSARLSFVGNLATLLAQLYLGIRWRRQVTDWDAERLRCEILFNRARAQITSDPTRLFFDSVAALRRFNEIDAGQVDQASAIYASGAGLFFYSGVSFAIGRRILTIAKQLMRSGNVKDAFTCASMDFICNYLKGDWSDAHVVDPGLVDAALRQGQLWDVNTYLGLLCDRHIRQGNFAAAWELLDQLADINTSYGYGFAGANRDGMQALLLLERRELHSAHRAADLYQAARHEDALKVLGLGTRAKAEVLLGELDAAAATLASTEKITTRSRTVPPWHLTACAAARLRYLAARLAGGDRTVAAGIGPAVRYALGLAAKVAVQRVEVHQLVGGLAWLQGKRRAALKHWNTAIAAGTQLRARPELARTYATVGRYLAGPDGGTLTVGGRNGPACEQEAQRLFAELGLPPAD